MLSVIDVEVEPTFVVPTYSRTLSLSVAPAVSARTHALNVFYTLTIGSSALSPPLSGLVGDLIEISGAVIVVAMLTLATVPLAFALRKGKGSAL